MTYALAALVVVAVFGLGVAVGIRYWGDRHYDAMTSTVGRWYADAAKRAQSEIFATWGRRDQDVARRTLALLREHLLVAVKSQTAGER